MDNTSYRYDLEESLLPYLEMKGVLTRDRLDPSLKLIPFKDQAGHKESLFSYYYRLCEIDDMVCYPWVAQVFSGFTLRGTEGLCRRTDGLRQADPRHLLRRRQARHARRRAAARVQRPARAVQQADGKRHRGLRDQRGP